MANKPVLIFDGHCGFCRIWLDYWRQLTGDRIEYLASQEVGDRFPQISREAYAKSVQLVRPDGSVASGARAVFESLGKERLYPWVAAPSELAYRIIAPHRDFFYQAHALHIRHTHRAHPLRRRRSGCSCARWRSSMPSPSGRSHCRSVDCWACAAWFQWSPFLASVERTGSALRFLAVPSLFWIAADDTTLVVLCFAGMVFAAMLLLTGFARGKFERFILSVALHPISVVRLSRPGISLLPMGFTAARSGIPGDLPGTKPHRAMAISLAGVPSCTSCRAPSNS